MNKRLIACQVIVLLMHLASCEEWYFPNSRMISDVEYKEKILNDRSTYKLVKFFTPHCQFCRYLKDVIDKLKAEREWSFEIYDFNCAWYPVVCNEVRAQSFPFTAVFNPQGEIQSSMVGFYPYPVVKETFEKIEESSAKFKQLKVSNLGKEEHEEKVERKAQPQKVEPVVQEEKIVEKPQDVHEKSVISNENEAKSKQKPQEIQHVTAPQHLSGVSQHLFYAFCFFLGVVYFASFIKQKKPQISHRHQQRINPEISKETMGHKDSDIAVSS